MKLEYRPWGSYRIIEEGEGYKIKEIQVTPGKRLSLQKHRQRKECWTIIGGEGKFTVGPDVKTLTTAIAKVGHSMTIKPKEIHRIENESDKELLCFIEVQTGDYLEEDDIERIEDDFGRV